MTIPEKAFYHGAALYELTHDEHYTSINLMPNVDSSSAYLLNHNIALYVKHSTQSIQNQGTKVWKYTFTEDQQEVVRKMFDSYIDHTFIAFICQDEGICVVNFGVLSGTVDFNYTESEWCEVYRSDGTSFRIRGKNGEHEYTIPLNAFPRRLFD